jgi:hypothetical protein
MFTNYSLTIWSFYSRENRKSYVNQDEICIQYSYLLNIYFNFFSIFFMIDYDIL